MGYYETNLRFLAHKEPLLAKRIEEIKEVSSQEVIQSFDYIPDDLSKSNAIVILGFGQGSHVKEILRRASKKTFVLVIDPDISQFKYVISSHDLSYPLSHPNLSLSIGEDPISAIHKRFDGAYGINTIKDIEVIFHSPSLKGKEKYYKEIIKNLQDIVNTASHNLSTLSEFAPRWFENILQNLPLLVKYPGIKGLFGKFKNIPAFIIGGGPSLDKNLHLLQEIKERGLIVTCDTSLRTLLFNEIEPHFVISLDGGEESPKHFDKVGKIGSFLVAFSITHPKIMSHFPGRVFVADFPHPLNEYLSLFLGEKGHLKSGGSVATSCFDLARICGANPIVFVGVDLGFPNGLTHSSGTFYIEEMVSKLDRFHTLEMLHHKKTAEEEKVWVEAIGGGRVATSRKLLAYLRWFEIEISSLKDRLVINAGEGGARIKGTYEVKLEKIINKFCKTRYKINETIESTHLSYTPPFSNSVKEGLKRLLDEFKYIHELSEKGNFYTDQLIEFINNGDGLKMSLLFSKISMVYKAIISQDLFMKIGRLDLEPLLAKMEEGKRNNPIDRARLCEYFFRKIRGYCYNSKQIIERTLDRL